MTPWRSIVLSSIILLVANSSASARPAHKQALADYFGPHLAKKLNDCRTCHLPDKPGQAKENQDEEKPHNVFGARMKAVRVDLRKAGKKTTIEDRLNAILQEDSDGDGASNLVELLSGRFPGDPSDKPSAAETAEVKKNLVAFQKFRSAYPWRPFETVKRSSLPTLKDPSWTRNPIDVFIAAEHETHRLQPRPEAPRHVLLRRLYLDLIGLPPTREELQAFLADNSKDAYEKVVDRLLQDPRYGERWGRHWMDIWRYSDWAGYGPQIRDSQPHIWRWRDWIIDALNEDMGYDRMILEMLAADELLPEDPKALRATGYLVRNFKLLSREKWLQDTVEHTFQAFQGVTLGCARCHDHMYDPFSQQEYYQVRAIFEPHQVRTDRLPGEPDIKKDGLVRAFDADLKVPTYLFIRGDDRTPDKSKPLIPGVPDALGSLDKIEPVSLPASAVNPDKRPFIIEETIRISETARSKTRAAYEALLEKASPDDEKLTLVKLDAEVAEARHEALLAVLRAEKLEDAGQNGSDAWQQAARAATRGQRQVAVLDARHKITSAKLKIVPPLKGKKTDPAVALADAEKRLAKAEADLKKPLDTNYAKRAGKTYPAQSTGRRLALARWLADRDNPLTARVAMNHIWLRHFGQAIVPSTFDFGRNGRQASHPALLDWLAAEFMEQGWSMKAMHRLIVTSSTYRLDSTPDADSLKKDQDNKYLWRFAPRRVEAEIVRDSIFHVAGKLDRTMSGPEIKHTDGLTVPRRSLYFQSASEKQMEFLQLFDVASVNECYERQHAIVPQQALALANSEMTRQHGRLLARWLVGKVGADPAAFTKAAFEQVLTRLPTDTELVECTTFLGQQTRYFQNAKLPPGDSPDGRLPSADPVQRARENLVHVLLNHHDFVTLR
jgi:hypothetical protein